MNKFNLKPKHLFMVFGMVVALAGLSAFTLFKPPVWTTRAAAIDASTIGTQADPTTDPELLRPVIEQIEQIQPQYGPGWVHWILSAYQAPDDPADPLSPGTGFTRGNTGIM